MVVFRTITTEIHDQNRNPRPPNVFKNRNLRLFVYSRVLFVGVVFPAPSSLVVELVGASVVAVMFGDEVAVGGDVSSATVDPVFSNSVTSDATAASDLTTTEFIIFGHERYNHSLHR